MSYMGQLTLDFWPRTEINIQNREPIASASNIWIIQPVNPDESAPSQASFTNAIIPSVTQLNFFPF